MLVDRRAFYEPDQILAQVERRIDEVESRGREDRLYHVCA
jgi:hypothetical protein